MKKGYLNWRDGLKLYGILIVFSAALTLSYIAIDSGALPTSEGNSQTGHSTYYLEVSATGETVFTSVLGASGAVAEEVWEEVRGEVYPTPEAAFAAVLKPLPGNVANAHAVLLCTTRDGVISNQTGSSYHETFHRFDRDGYRYTKTYHVTWSGTGYVVTDVFYGKVNKKYC